MAGFDHAGLLLDFTPPNLVSFAWFFFCWLMLTIGGNSIFSNSLARMIEAPYQNINVLELERFDAVIVLGGGTNTTLGGHAQGAGAGDRILVAAKLYHGGITSKLICTGSQPNRSTPKDLHPREEAIKILTGIGVPRESLIQLKGNNTSEEMRNIKLWIDQQNESGALGAKTTRHLDVGLSSTTCNSTG